MIISALRKIPFIRNKLDHLAQEPDIHIGDYQGLFYRINKEAIECTDFVTNYLKLEDSRFIKVYNVRFKTRKFTPFVLKWVSLYILELLTCLYRVQLDTPTEKVLYLRNNPLNRHIYEWWHRKTAHQIQVAWLKESEFQAGWKALISIPVLFISKILSRGLCLPVRPKKYKIIKEATWGLNNPIMDIF